jgi:hypothetical protein
MPETSSPVRIAPWKDNKRFAYSVTYDEGLVEILGFAWRLHCDHGIPGHISAVPGLLGKLEGDMSAGFLQSLWNLRKFAEPAHLQFLVSQGWTVGCQFAPSKDGGAAREGPAGFLQEQRALLEAAIGCPVQSLAFADATSAAVWQEAAMQAGFDWLFTLYDALNAPDDPARIIRRSPLYHRGPLPNRLANDPYRLLALARDRGDWVVDVVRLVDRYTQDSTRDCTPAELEARFNAVQTIGQENVWLASPVAVADYRFLRWSSRVENVLIGPRQINLTLKVSGTHPSCSSLTLVVQTDPAWRSPQARFSTGAQAKLKPAAGGDWLLECPAIDGLKIAIIDLEE